MQNDDNNNNVPHNGIPSPIDIAIPDHIGPEIEESDRTTTKTEQSSGLEDLTKSIVKEVAAAFSIGKVLKVYQIHKGSSQSAKFRIRTQSNGEFFLKQRSAKHVTTNRIGWVHKLILHLQGFGYPIPELLRAHNKNTYHININNHIYELSQLAHGTAYDKTVRLATCAGAVLAQFHFIAANVDEPVETKPISSTYHDAQTVLRRIENRAIYAIQKTNKTLEHNHNGEIINLVDRLLKQYENAAYTVESLGYANWPISIIHADWHPGNLLFHGRKVSAVLDLDTARPDPRIADIANGALQFALRADGADPDLWPDSLDELRWIAFCNGYDRYSKQSILSIAEIKAMPHLMIEAMIAESIVSVAKTGTIGSFPGYQFLKMVERKSKWLETHADRMIRLLQA